MKLDVELDRFLAARFEKVAGRGIDAAVNAMFMRALDSRGLGRTMPANKV